jgi:hypothetical protein
MEPKRYPFVPLESYGRLGQPAMKLLHALSNKAAGPVEHASFVGALRELVAQCRAVQGHCFNAPCLFGNAREVQWNGVVGWHACTHGRAWDAGEFLLVMFCLPVPVISMWTT